MCGSLAATRKIGKAARASVRRLGQTQRDSAAAVGRLRRCGSTTCLAVVGRRFNHAATVAIRGKLLECSTGQRQQAVPAPAGAPRLEQPRMAAASSTVTGSNESNVTVDAARFDVGLCAPTLSATR